MTLWKGVLVAVLGVGALHMLRLLSTGLGAEPRVEITLNSVPAAHVVAGFSILAALGIALQVAVRTPSSADAMALARRRYLCDIAKLMVAATLVLAVYSVIPALMDAPTRMDIVRLVAPAIAGWLVALIAADAGVAADPDFDVREINRAWRTRRAQSLSDVLTTVERGSTSATPASIGTNILVLVLVPVMTAVVSVVFAPRLDFGLRVLAVVLALVLALLVYVLSVRVYISVAVRDWAELVVTLLFVPLASMLVWGGFLATMGGVSRDGGDPGIVARAAVCLVVYVAVAAALAAWSLSARPGKPLPLLALLVARPLRKRRERLSTDTAPAPVRPKLNRLAAVAPWLSIFVPFGLFLAVIARQQILHANDMAPAKVQRGLGHVVAAMVITALMSAAMVTLALTLAAAAGA